jgi:hypothetical protein
MNQFQLHNRSFLTIGPGVVLSASDETLVAQFPSYKYQTREQLDEYLLIQRVQVFFRPCSSKGAILPLATPVCIHAPKAEQHGDLFIEKGSLNLDTTDPSMWGQVFDARVIQPALRVVPTVAYSTGRGLVGVLVGSRPQEQISVIKTALLNRAPVTSNAPAPTQPAAKPVVMSDALTKLKETVGSI